MGAADTGAAAIFGVAPPLRVDHPVRGALHGSAACASLAVALYVAWLPRDAAQAQTVFIVLALSHCALYAVSALYHSAPWCPTWKCRMQRLDHSLIYVKVAGTLTPFLWLGASGDLRGPLVATSWAIAAAGVANKWVRRGRGAPVRLQLAQLCLLLPPALRSVGGDVPLGASALLMGAATCYTAGAAVYLTRRPQLWPGVFSFHELFHLLLVFASACVYVFLLAHVV
jgi:hemolysin III